MVDEFSAAAIDCAGTAAHRHGETRHPQRGHFDMELLVREGLDVQPQQGLAVDLARRARTLPRCIIRSREPNDLAIAVADSCDAARSAHGQTPARVCAICARAAQTYPVLSLDRSERFKVSAIFAPDSSWRQRNGFVVRSRRREAPDPCNVPK